MITITNTSKIYVVCPAWSATGGVECLHQLIDKLNKNGLNAFAVYIDHKKNIVKDVEIRSEYKCYNIKKSNEIEKNFNNLVIVPEVDVDLIFRFNECQLMIYWLSVDNFFWSFRHDLSHIDMLNWNIQYALKTNILGRYYHQFIKSDKIFSKRSTLYINVIRNKNIIHAYQSKYAQNFLTKKGFRNVIELNDYINSNYYSDIKKSGRENIVLYNPRKGVKFTKKLIQNSPHIKWIALQNRTRIQIIDHLQKSKLYVDFGEHPGRDRFPREAVMNGCCVITGLRGSAYYFEDVPIDKQYKFEDKRGNIKSIINKIDEILMNFENHFDNFEFYRCQIQHDEKKLEQLVLMYFCVRK